MDQKTIDAVVAILEDYTMDIQGFGVNHMSDEEYAKFIINTVKENE